MFAQKNKSPRRDNSSRFKFSFPEFDFVKNLKASFEEHGLLPAKSVKKVGWVFGLIMIYIFFQHNIETLIVRMEKSEVKMKEMRAAYITNKAGYMFESKHSEISKKMSSIGMDTNIEPPIKIVVQD
ncbi:hypothetical protein SAMN06298216_1950 [Spirosomataceae bacterium TFI 002]|nr:hypothetical protein SAMN06298216_1950 [Spirosomataceae bacterium TFI 002]